MTRTPIGTPNWGAALNTDLDSIETLAITQAVPTGSRPSAVTSGAGTMVYDTTLAKPIWSNGTVWKDATGTTV